MSTGEGRGVRKGSLSLPFCPCFFLYFVLFLLLFCFSSLFFEVLLSSLPFLFSVPTTHCMTPTRRHGDTNTSKDQPTRRPTSRCDLAHWLHSTQLLCTACCHACDDSSILSSPSPPPPPLTTSRCGLPERGNFTITGIFSARILLNF